MQNEHYIDNGCFCKLCTNKRRDIYFKAKNGEKKFEKIIHTEEIENRNIRINELIKIKNQEIKLNKKFLNNQFKIQLK